MTIIRQQARLELGEEQYENIVYRCKKVANHLVASRFYPSQMVATAEGDVGGMIDTMLAWVIERDGDVDSALDEYIKYIGREYSRSYQRIQALLMKGYHERPDVHWSTLGQWYFESPDYFVDSSAEGTLEESLTEASSEIENIPGHKSQPAGEAEASVLEAPSLPLRVSELGDLRPWKRCAHCTQAKDLDEFHNRSDSPDGKQSKCKDCSRAYNRHRHRRWWPANYAARKRREGRV